MSSRRVILGDHPGPLAAATCALLRARGMLVERRETGDGACSAPPLADTVVCFPFPAARTRSALASSPAHLRALDRLLGGALAAGARRIVLRSHGLVYEASWRTAGLCYESDPLRVSGGPEQRRWLDAEAVARAAVDRCPGATLAILRLAPLVDPREGDPVSGMLAARAAAPLFGFDPPLQLLDLEDAAAALVAAVLARADGVFNVAPTGALPLKRALAAAGVRRVPIARWLQRPGRALLWRTGFGTMPVELLEHLRYGAPLAAARAAAELGWTPAQSTAGALRRQLVAHPRARPGVLPADEDVHGFDPAYVTRWRPWFEFLARRYFHIAHEGIEHVPADGPAVLVANHAGFMPIDGVMHRHLILRERARRVRWLILPSVRRLPVVHDFIVKQGGVPLERRNGERLLAGGEIVGIFPEGIAGGYRLVRDAYRLAPFNAGFARLALISGAPVVPAAVIGHVESLPILGRIDRGWIPRVIGTPFFPVTPTFPWPLPLPGSWRIRYLEPVRVATDPACPPAVVRDLVDHVRGAIQREVDDLLRRRGRVFVGRLLARASGAR